MNDLIPLTPEALADYEKRLTPAGLNVLIGWLLQDAIDRPVIADSLARFHACCTQRPWTQALNECFRRPPATLPQAQAAA